MRKMLWCCCCVFLLSQCAEKADSDNAGTQLQSDEPIVPVEIDYAAATAYMAATLARSFANIDPAKATFLVEKERAEMFRQQLQSQDISTRITAWSYYANALFTAGKTEQSIVEFEAVLKEYNKYNIEADVRLQMRKLLAMAYLRLGEEANCVTVRNQESCILPISQKGRYTMTRGSESAMHVCLQILDEFPDDHETIYILNLAAMTIGKYPSAVPVKWRLPASSVQEGSSFTKFREISAKVGIKGVALAGGSCVEDFDGDGWLDIITSSWGKNDPLVFWRSTGQGTFIDASEGMGLKGITGGLNLLHADINNDGLADIFVPRGAWLRDQGKIPNSLILNLGNGKFADITKVAGVLTFAGTQTAAFADFNLDGWIDFFVGNESAPQHPFPNEFYLNNKNNTFRNVMKQIGVNVDGFIKGCVAGDINNDGWPDLYISKFSGANMLLLHQGLDVNGIPKFENIAPVAGVEEPIVSFPTWIWDYDNDGWEDIFVSGYGEGELFAARDFVLNAKGQKLKGNPRVYHNNGNKTFTDVTAAMGMTDNVYTMGCNFGDLDADGFLDFYLGTGAPEYSSVVPNKMYRNNAGQHFDDITAMGGFGHIQKGHAVGFGDLDRDGDEDIFESMGGAFHGDVFEDILFENPIGQDKSWIVLQLQGVKANRMAVGSRVKITVTTPDGTRSFYRTVTTGASFGSNSLQLEVGLGNANAIEEIEITWPNIERTKQVFKNIPLKKYVRIVEGDDAVQYPEVTAVSF